MSFRRCEPFSDDRNVSGEFSSTLSVAQVFSHALGAADTLLIMSTAGGWDFTVPEDPDQLAAELRRHGVLPGQRLHVVPTPGTANPRRPLRGALAGHDRSPSWEDFQAASEQATAEAEARYQDGGRWNSLAP